MIEVEVEEREGAGENSNLEAKRGGNECLTTDRLSRATWYEYFARAGGYSNIYKRNRRGREIWDEVSISFSVSGGLSSCPSTTQQVVAI